MDLILPSEILTEILSYLSIKDLVRIERTCKLLQCYALSEIERRIRRGSSKDEWGILIHLGQVMAQPIRFDPVSKMAYYSIMMDPVKIKTMFDHKRPIHCSLLRKNNSDYGSKNAFIITVEKGMKEGKTIQMDIKNDLCQVQAELTRLPTPPPSPELQKQDYFKTDSISSLAPAPLTYTLQITELCLPLSTIAA